MDTPTGRTSEQIYVNPARRCAECHNRIEEQWASSAHARAATSSLYRAMRERVGPAKCDDCHAPLDRLMAPSSPVKGEGVTCDVCHTTRVVTLGERSSDVDRALNDDTRYGPLADAKSHYFHRMGYASLYGEAQFCAGCHHGAHSLPSDHSPIFSEYSEWQAGPYGEQGRPCQDCHMPAATDEVATGAGVRTHVHHHGWLGADGELRHRAVRASLVLQRTADRVHVDVSIENARAGHSIPTGLPERRIRVDAVTTDEHGAVAAKAEAAYGIHLVDAEGRPAPFFKAARQIRDDRLRPKETRVEHFTLAAPREGRLVVRIVWNALDPDIARSLGIESPASDVLAEASIPIGPATLKQSQTVRLSR
jgi:hypothetical protein